MTYPSKSDVCVFEADCQKFRQNSRDPDHLKSQHKYKVFSFCLSDGIHETLQTPHPNTRSLALKYTQGTNDCGSPRTGTGRHGDWGEREIYSSLYTLSMVSVFLPVHVFAT